MKKIVITVIVIALAITSLVLNLNLTLNKPQGADTPDDTTAQIDDGKANHLTINLRVYSMVDTKKQTKLEEREIIIGAYNMVVGYDDGETITANTILLQLADMRNANVELTSSGTVDKITFDGVTYSSGRKLNLERKGQEQNSNKDFFDVYYYDVMIWEWTLNNQLVDKIGDVTFQDGDQLILTLNYDNTSTAGYELAEDVETEAEAE